MDWRAREREQTRQRIETETDERQGVVYWKSNGAPVPPHVFRDAGLEASSVQVEVYEAQQAEFLAEYRERMADHEPSAEELFELRAAFGPGAEVVNVITGKRTWT